MMLEDETDDIVIEKTVKYFEKIFKRKIKIPKKYFVTRWGKNPYTYGSYSYLSVGASSHDRVNLANIEHGRLFFAGEATSTDFPATARGAYLSGIREAEKIKKLFP